MRELYEWLAGRFRLIRFDARNSGLSQRAVEDVSVDARMLDLDAVADRLGLDSFYLVAHGMSTPAAVAFAATQPDRVSRLILRDATIPLPGIEPTPPVRALAEIVDYDWVTFTEMLASLVYGWTGEERTQYAALIRASVTWEDWTRLSVPADVSAYLAQITIPTLIIHHRDAIVTTIETGKALAARIPGARLVSQEGRGVASGWADPRVLAAIDAFLSEDEAAPAPLSAPGTGMTAILFADIADSTGLTEQMGDAAFRGKARELDGALRAVIHEHAGTPIEGKLLGDGVLAVFTSARQAIEAALACVAAGSRAGLPLHLGLHAGDVIREENNVYGGAVNIASRIAGLSAAGEVLVSETVRSLARTSAGVRFEDRGEQSLRGVGEPVRVWAVVPGA